MIIWLASSDPQQFLLAVEGAFQPVVREQAARGRQRRREREQLLERPNLAALVLDVAVVASKKRQRRGIARAVGDEVSITWVARSTSANDI